MNLDLSSHSSDEVMCSTPNCGHNFGNYPNGMEPAEQRQPCPQCGGQGRTVTKTLTAEVKTHASLIYDAHPPGPKSKRRRFAWGFTGWDFAHSFGRLVRKDSQFNKRANRRYEHVEDPETGEVLHHQDHPLTEHKGHGSDKKKVDG
jgi:hypothetical protein